MTLAVEEADGKKAECHGIYTLEGDDLKLWLYTRPAGAPPDDFVTSEGDHNQIFLLKRVKPK